MAESCKDPTLWEVLTGIILLFVALFIGVGLLIGGILAAIVGVSSSVLALIFGVAALCLIATILLALWVKSLMDKLRMSWWFLDMLRRGVDWAEEWLGKPFAKKA